VSSVLLICTGNICRSPMAEGMLRDRLEQLGIEGISVGSSGVAGLDRSPAVGEAIRAVAELGVDISDHVARRFHTEHATDSDLVITMTEEQSAIVNRLAPRAADRTFTLKELVSLLDHMQPAAPGADGQASSRARLRAVVEQASELRAARAVERPADIDIADPLGLGLEAFRAVAWELEQLTDRLVGTLFPEEWAAAAAGDGAPPHAAHDAAGYMVSVSGDGADPLNAEAGGSVGLVADWHALAEQDPEVAGAIANELRRERSMLRLIASENYTSPAVLAALASTFNDKYAEGYPGRRYYGGCEYIDQVETLAIERATQLFGADHANVQPHAGASANLAVYGAFLDPKDESQRVLGLVLAHGGHLTHGSPVNFSGKWFQFVGYEVDRETETIDLDRVRALALEHRPRIILAGFTAYPRAIDFAGFRRIADEVGALFMVDASHFIGLVAGDAYPSPVPYADVVTFTTHKTLRGPRGAVILCREEHAKAIDKAVFPMMQGGPLGSAIAAKAVAFHEAMQPSFADYAQRTVRSARALAESLAEEGLRLVSGGTDSHLALVDLRPIGINGAEAERLCEEVGIALNKNAIPFDPLPPSTSSGIRVGTPGPATLGMDEEEMREVGRAIGALLRAPEDAATKDRVTAFVRDLMAHFPPYPPVSSGKLRMAAAGAAAAAGAGATPGAGAG
jgi:glycine hydroxymethyltransferase